MKETVYRIPESTAISIALLVDTHNVEPEPILASLQSYHPDIIAIAGDVFVGHRPTCDELIVQSQDNVLPLIFGCASIATTYISLGNHEWMISNDDVELLEGAGATVLDNRYVAHTGETGADVVIGGLTSAIVTNYQEFRKECYETGRNVSRYPYRPMHSHISCLSSDSAWLSEFEKEQGYKILLCHTSGVLEPAGSISFATSH